MEDFNNELYRQSVIILEALGVDTYNEDFPISISDIPGMLEAVSAEMIIEE